LQSEYQSLFQLIHVIQCFGTKDCLNLELVGSELERRGYDIQEGATVTFVKEDTDEDTEEEESQTD
jgi:hypothetical protein